MPESSRLSKPRADNADMTSRPTLAIPNSAPPSATAGSQATSRPATSNGRSPSCNSSTPTLKSSPTLHPDSTTAERDLLPYWNDYTRAISSHLWLPTATNSPGSASNSSSKSSSKTVDNSWFSTSEISAPRRNSPRIYSPSLLSSLQEPTDSEGTARNSRKIRIYPDRDQKTKLKLWFDASRFTYNRTIELLTSDGAPNASWLTIKKDILTRLPDWTKPAPYEVKSHAITGRMPGNQRRQEVQQAADDRQGQRTQTRGKLRKGTFPLPEEPQPNHFHPRIGPQPKRRLPHHPGRTEKAGTNTPRPRRCQAHTEPSPVPPERTVQKNGTPPQ